MREFEPPAVQAGAFAMRLDRCSRPMVRSSAGRMCSRPRFRRWRCPQRDRNQSRGPAARQERAPAARRWTLSRQDRPAPARQGGSENSMPNRPATISRLEAPVVSASWTRSMLIQRCARRSGRCNMCEKRPVRAIAASWVSAASCGPMSSSPSMRQTGTIGCDNDAAPLRSTRTDLRPSDSSK